MSIWIGATNAIAKRGNRGEGSSYVEHGVVVIVVPHLLAFPPKSTDKTHTTIT